MGKKNLIVFTGAGVSQESGLGTFRDNDGLWEQYRIEDVATPQAWQANQQLVLDFYNQRRKQLFEANPNTAHHIISDLQTHFDVTVITQNVDDLHERAGSEKVIHLHGELKKVRSSRFPELIYNLDHWELKAGDLCEKGHQLRPHIVWFGEEVPQMEIALELVEGADILVVVGTSLNVYPAAGVVDECPGACPKYIVDPNEVSVPGIRNISHIKQPATKGMTELKSILLDRHL